MMFVAGTAIVGIVHQATWIATSPEPLFQSSSNFRETASSNTSLNNVKQLSQGNHGFAAARETLVPGGTADSHGRRTHGWHALLLPFAEQQPLYDQIQFDKAWDDESNSDAYRTNVESYTNPWIVRQEVTGSDSRGYPLTDYASNVHVVGPMTALRSADVSDGANKTLLFGEVTEERKPWGYPANWRDPALGINRDPNGFGGPWSRKGANFAMADGSARFISEDVDPEVLRAMATPAGGEDVDDP
jgi:prepilin-type processing-associated H-X9-DG protein